MTDDGREVMNEIRVKTMNQVEELMQRGLNGIKTLDEALTRIDDELILRMPDITMTLANLRQATSQLKLVALEIRRSRGRSSTPRRPTCWSTRTSTNPLAAT